MLVFPPNPITDYNSSDYRDRNEGTARFLRGLDYYYTPVQLQLRVTAPPFSHHDLSARTRDHVRR